MLILLSLIILINVGTLAYLWYINRLLTSFKNVDKLAVQLYESKICFQENLNDIRSKFLNICEDLSKLQHHIEKVNSDNKDNINGFFSDVQFKVFQFLESIAIKQATEGTQGDYRYLK